MSILKASLWKPALILAVVSLCACAPHTVQPTPSVALCHTEAHFSRRGGAADSVIQTLNQARSKIQVAMYGLTYAGIVDAMVAANSRGVDVALKTDKIESAGKTQAAMIAKLEQAGIPVDDVSMQSRLLHHKFVVIDDRYVSHGSRR